MNHLFELLTGFPPLRWQQRLYSDHFAKADLPAAVDVPTGLGKTAVMALWLLARGDGKPLPRRLVYVVDRRAVVDQATAFAEQIQARLSNPRSSKDLQGVRDSLGLDDGEPLPISTLRGQYIDNRQWLEDPSVSAIIVGTVDMVGSRLLFEGYGVSRKMRPYHAGLLGTDTLVVLDEAHLVPPFEHLLDHIERDPDRSLRARDPKDSAIFPRFRLLSLSATGRARKGITFQLEDGDITNDSVTMDRLGATKLLRIVETPSAEPPRNLHERLAETAWALTHEGTDSTRCIVFCDSREVATKTAAGLAKSSKRTEARVELFVGARRGYERKEAERKLTELGFLAGGPIDGVNASTFLVATSAGEVGVDLDADHMVSDVVPWERMVQRLGRVNRRGGAGRSARVRVVAEAEQGDVQRHVLELLLEHLPRRDEGTDVSSAALRQLKSRAKEDPGLQGRIDAATTAPPLRPALTRPLVDAWSMTSLEEHTGRPEIAPWLRGWVDDLPQTRVAWRRHLPIKADGIPVDSEAVSFFEASPPHATEVLETSTWRVMAWILKRAKSVLSSRRGSPDASALLSADAIVACVLSGSRNGIAFYTATDLAGPRVNITRLKRDLERELAGATLVVDARLGGLDDTGSLEEKAEEAPKTLDGRPGFDDGNAPPVVPFRIVSRTKSAQLENNEHAADWRHRYRFVIQRTEDEIERWLDVEQWHHEGDLEDDRSVTCNPQRLSDHQSWAEAEAKRVAGRLGLPAGYSKALQIAARLHDEGKRAERWQRAFRAPRESAPNGEPVPYAKTKGPVSFHLLAGYRHEFGSLPYAEGDAGFLALPPHLRDLVLHVIAAHHGFGRPSIAIAGSEDQPPTALQERARQVALRFLRLQARWGPWGLAYWEALLRAADQRASRANDAMRKGKK